MPKLSIALRHQLAGVPEGHPVEIVVEVGRKAATAPVVAAPSGRAQKIAALKKDFSASAAPIEQAIERSGGTVLDRAWINQSIKARLPREAVEALGEREDVELVDTPQLLQVD